MINAISPDFDITPLVCAMAEQAARETQRGDKHAALWLATDGAFMLDAVGMDSAAYQLGKLGRDVVWKHPRQSKRNIKK